MRWIRFLHSVAFAVGMTVALNGTILLLTERIVIYPNERSLPLLQLNRVEENGASDAAAGAGHETPPFARVFRLDGHRSGHRRLPALSAGRRRHVATRLESRKVGVAQPLTLNLNLHS